MRTAIANDACVGVKQTGPVTVIVMKQPERLNALSPQLLIDLHQSLSMAAQDPHCRCLILTGSGREFCAGADLSHFNGSDNQEQATDLAATLHETYHPIIRLMRGMEKPVITAVNGVAASAGCSIALAGDIVLWWPFGQLHTGLYQTGADPRLAAPGLHHAPLAALVPVSDDEWRATGCSDGGAMGAD